MKRLALLFALVGVTTSESMAFPPQRCRGVVQFRPCDDHTPPAANRAQLRHEPIRLTPLPRGKIVESSFSPVGDRDGIWRGIVRGAGELHLVLRIRSGDGKINERYMGSVGLAGNETTFAFRTVRPAGDDWEWSIASFDRAPTPVS